MGVLRSILLLSSTMGVTPLGVIVVGHILKPWASEGGIKGEEKRGSSQLKLL